MSVRCCSRWRGVALGNWSSGIMNLHAGQMPAPGGSATLHSGHRVPTLVGTDVGKIVDTTEWLVRDTEEYERRSRIHNPYGDGHTSERIGDILTTMFSRVPTAVGV